MWFFEAIKFTTIYIQTKEIRLEEGYMYGMYFSILENIVVFVAIWYLFKIGYRYIQEFLSNWHLR